MRDAKPTSRTRAATARAGAALACALIVATCGGGGGRKQQFRRRRHPRPPPPPPPEPTDPLGEVGTVEEERVRLFETLGEDMFAVGYAGLRDAADELEGAVGTYCDAPSSDQDDVEDAWRHAMAAWQEVQLLAVGPVEEANRRFRLQFFPDNNEAVERGVDSALAGDGPITEAGIAEESVGVQGLPAIEYLLFAIGGWGRRGRRLAALRAGHCGDGEHRDDHGGDRRTVAVGRGIHRRVQQLPGHLFRRLGRCP